MVKDFLWECESDHSPKQLFYRSSEHRKHRGCHSCRVCDISRARHTSPRPMGSHTSKACWTTKLYTFLKLVALFALVTSLTLSPFKHSSTLSHFKRWSRFLMLLNLQRLPKYKYNTLVSKRSTKTCKCTSKMRKNC